MTTIDHKATALMILDHGTVVSAETEALVHATIYVGEQARIANLLEMRRQGLTHTETDGLHHNAQEDWFARVPDWKLRPDIAQALGLDKEGS